MDVENTAYAAHRRRPKMASGESLHFDTEWDAFSDNHFRLSWTPSPTPPADTETRRTGSADRGPSRTRQRAPDSRQPTASTSRARQAAEAEVIDLTFEDSDEAPSDSQSRYLSGRQAHRLPRFAREIIDVEEDEAMTYNSGETAQRSSSPDVEFIEARQLPGRTRPPTPPVLHTGEHEFAFLETRRLPTPHVVARARHNRAARNAGQRPENWRQQMQHQIQTRVAQLQGMGPFGLFPINLNFESVGFDLGTARENTRTPAPIFEPPPPAPEGFTRTLKEGEVVVCPNCGDELCEGKTEQKKQVWVVKKCGHVYCGDCYHNRTVSKNRKAKSTSLPATNPFKVCVIEGCEQKTNNKGAMIQVYL